VPCLFLGPAGEGPGRGRVLDGHQGPAELANGIVLLQSFNARGKTSEAQSTSSDVTISGGAMRIV